jgi:Zn-dependent protease with chaperone function
MITGLALMAGAISVGAVGHLPLLRWGARWRDPFAAITCWVLSIAGVLLTFVVSAVLLVLPGDRPGALAEHFTHGCWLVLTHYHAPVVDEATGAAGLAVAAFVTVRLVLALHTRMRAQHLLHDQHVSLLHIAGTRHDAGAVLWLPHQRPFAYSVAGRPGVVVASTGLRTLPAAWQTAVLHHERAHLRRRHHMLLTLTGALAQALPFLPLARHAPGALGLLLELDADRQAVRSCGHRAVRDALLAVSHPTAPPHALAMTGSDVPHRLHRLRADPHPSRMRLACMRTCATVGPVTLPAAASLATLLIALILSCPHP